MGGFSGLLGQSAQVLEEPFQVDPSLDFRPVEAEVGRHGPLRRSRRGDSAHETATGLGIEDHVEAPAGKPGDFESAVGILMEEEDDLSAGDVGNRAGDVDAELSRPPPPAESGRSSPLGRP